MAQAEDPIESITNKSPSQRQASWERWQEVFDAAQEYLDNPENDFLENHLIQKLMVLSTHMQSQMAKQFEQADTKLILDHKIDEIKEASKPKLTTVALYVTQIFASILGAGLGCAPSILGVTGNAAKSYQALSGGVQGLGQGSQNMASLVQSKDQAQAEKLRQMLETHKAGLQSHTQEFQRQQQMAQRHAEDKKHEEQKRHETTKAITNG